MTAHASLHAGLRSAATLDLGGAGFPDSARAGFAAAYPGHAARLAHNLAGHSLFSRDAIAALAERLPEDRVEYNLGALPLGIAAEETPANGLSIADTIGSIDRNGSWMVLKNVERDPAYGALLDALLAELAPLVRPRTGAMAQREAFIFLSSPDSITPFHMDPEHNILLQIEGSKAMTVFPAGNPDMVPPERSEAFHAGGHRNLPWRDSFEGLGRTVTLNPGDAILVPVKAPHFVRNGGAVSVSFSITWRSARSVAEGELHGLNATLNRWGLPRIGIGQRPERQRLARLALRFIRKLGG